MNIIKKNYHTVFSLLTAALIAMPAANAQVGIGKDYNELSDNATYDKSGWNKVEDGLQASWASKDAHYSKVEVPSVKMKKDTTIYAWRGERVTAEAILFSRTRMPKISLRLSEWRKGSTVIPASQGEARFLRYVLSDEKRGCGTNAMNTTTRLRPDVIDVESSLAILAHTARPVWLTLEVPATAEAGEYTLTLDAFDAATNEVLNQLTLHVNVLDRTLPPPAQWSFHLDFWQQPYSVSRYYNVAKWSQAHFDAMRPFMELLARAGQRCVTAILFYEPWGEQSNDKHDAMVQTTKQADGTWTYDYTVFDRWVEFMESCGISEQINCYSMIPWDKTFRYYDAKQGRDIDLKCEVSSKAYAALWTPFLKAFAEHLREKGWYDKTCIAMDERGLEDMLKAYEILQDAVPGMKMSLAGHHHIELTDKLFDYSLGSSHRFTEAELKFRREKGWHSTAYYCCSEYAPNIFTNSLPAEGAYLPLFCLANGFEGLLHWSYMDWVDDPLRDSRFKLFPGGDTYCIYPGMRSSVRFERLIEGIQAYEKARILIKEYTEAGRTEELAKLNETIKLFVNNSVSDYYPASFAVNAMHSVLNGIPQPEAQQETYCPVIVTDINGSTTYRYLTSVEVTGTEKDGSFSTKSAPANGMAELPQPVKVKRGQTFRIRTTGFTHNDGLQYCRLGIFADWNADSVFNMTGNELVMRVGAAQSANSSVLSGNYPVTVPEDAATERIKLRMVYADAWRGEPVPCGEAAKGFCFDIPLLVTDGTETAISQPTSALLNYNWKDSVLCLDRPANITVYSANGAIVDQQANIQRYDTRSFLRGTYIVVLRSDKGVESLKFCR